MESGYDDYDLAAFNESTEFIGHDSSGFKDFLQEHEDELDPEMLDTYNQTDRSAGGITAEPYLENWDDW